MRKEKIIKCERKFKDVCDMCNTFDYCKGFNGKVLCPSCTEIEYQKLDKKGKQIQMSIFDLRKEK